MPLRLVSRAATLHRSHASPLPLAAAAALQALRNSSAGCLRTSRRRDSRQRRCTTNLSPSHWCMHTTPSHWCTHSKASYFISLCIHCKTSSRSSATCRRFCHWSLRRLLHIVQMCRWLAENPLTGRLVVVHSGFSRCQPTQQIRPSTSSTCPWLRASSTLFLGSMSS